MTLFQIKPALINRATFIRLICLGLFILVTLLVIMQAMFMMPGTSYSGSSIDLNKTEIALKGNLQQDIDILANQIGIRNYLNERGLRSTVDFIDRSFSEAGYTVEHQQYTVKDKVYDNIIVEIAGNKSPSEVVVVGAHYDTAFYNPGANDNASGTAAIIELAKLLRNFQPDRTLRLVAFVNEEPPFFWTENMGSLVYARRCKQKQENIVAMLSLETMGYYTDKIDSQKYPSPLNLIYPSQGNFISFVGNLKSRKLVKQTIKTFRQNTKFPSEGAALPNILPGIGWSDHWSFWQQGYPAIMITDTAPFRYPYYHTLEDTTDKINYDSLSRVTLGIKAIIIELTTN